LNKNDVIPLKINQQSAWIVYKIVTKNTYPSENLKGAIEKSHGEFSGFSRFLNH